MSLFVTDVLFPRIFEFVRHPFKPLKLRLVGERFSLDILNCNWCPASGLIYQNRIGKFLNLVIYSTS